MKKHKIDKIRLMFSVTISIVLIATTFSVDATQKLANNVNSHDDLDNNPLNEDINFNSWPS